MEVQELRPHILAVDDNKNFGETLKLILKDRYRVTVVLNAKAAKEALDVTRFDLMLLDLDLPRISGLEFLRFIIPEFPGLSIIMLTGTSDLNTAIECMKAGACDYVVKEGEDFSARLHLRIEQALKQASLIVKNSRLEAEVSRLKPKISW